MKPLITLFFAFVQPPYFWVLYTSNLNCLSVATGLDTTQEEN